MQVKTVGVVTILGASVMWAIEPVVTRLSYENSNFIHTSAIRSFIITVMALIYAIAINGSTLLIKRNKIPPLLYIAIGGTLCADLLYYYALSHVLVLNAVLVAHIQPLFVILIAFLWYLGLAVATISDRLHQKKINIHRLTGRLAKLRGRLYRSVLSIPIIVIAKVVSQHLEPLHPVAELLGD